MQPMILIGYHRRTNTKKAHDQCNHEKLLHKDKNSCCELFMLAAVKIMPHVATQSQWCQ